MTLDKVHFQSFKYEEIRAWSFPQAKAYLPFPVPWSSPGKSATSMFKGPLNIFIDKNSLLPIYTSLLGFIFRQQNNGQLFKFAFQ